MKRNFSRLTQAKQQWASRSFYFGAAALTAGPNPNLRFKRTHVHCSGVHRQRVGGAPGGPVPTVEGSVVSYASWKRARLLSRHDG